MGQSEITRVVQSPVEPASSSGSLGARPAQHVQDERDPLLLIDQTSTFARSAGQGRGRCRYRRCDDLYRVAAAATCSAPSDPRCARRFDSRRSGSASNESAAGPTARPLTAAQKSAAMDALERIAPPTGFIGTSGGGSAVRLVVLRSLVLPAPAICFWNTTPIPVLTNGSARTLLAQFGVRPDKLACDQIPVQVPLSNCPGYGSFAGYGLGIILTVVHARFSDQRSGTQVVLFAVRAK